MNVMEIFGKFISDSKRIFVVSRKPTKEEYKRMSIIIALGIIIIGIIGYVIYLIFALSGLGLGM
jgi:protein transport protein SEC61 subunit gamma and related proteins